MRRTALLVSLLMLGDAATALAQPPGPPPDHDGPPGMGRRGPPPIDRVLARHADELALDEATRDAIQVIAARSRQVEQPLNEELHQLHEGLRTLLDADAPNRDDVMQWADRIGAAETELKKHRLRTMLEVRALLSPEQRQTLVKIFEQRKARRKGFGGGPPSPDEESDR